MNSIIKFATVIGVFFLSTSCSKERLLFDAIADGDSEKVEKVLQSKVKLDIRNADGLTPLWLSCSKNQEEIIKLLLKAGANPNFTTRRNNDENRHPDDVGAGRTPLYLACSMNNLNIVKLLVQYGARISNTEEEFLSIYDYSNYDIFELLIKQKRKNNMHGPNHLLEITKILGYKKWKLKQDTNSYNAKEFVILKMAHDMIKLGENVDQKNFNNNSSLHIACEEGIPNMVKLLVQSGANLNSQNLQFETPLHRAVIFKNDLAIIHLLENGADINIKAYGKTPYELAIDRNYLAGINIFKTRKKLFLINRENKK